MKFWPRREEQYIVRYRHVWQNVVVNAATITMTTQLQCLIVGQIPWHEFSLSMPLSEVPPFAKTKSIQKMSFSFISQIWHNKSMLDQEFSHVQDAMWTNQAKRRDANSTMRSQTHAVTHRASVHEIPTNCVKAEYKKCLGTRNKNTNLK